MIGVGHVEITPAMRRNVAKVLDSAWLSPGPLCKEFEQQWGSLHMRTYVAFVNSGTSALHIGLAAMKELYGWPDGAKVIAPALTFVASINVILQNNLTPVLVDVDEFYGLRTDGWPADAVAVMPVLINGQWVDPAVYDQAKALGLKVIDDSCETVHAVHLNRGVSGSLADVTCFSTYACHHVTTGVGGFAGTNDPGLGSLIRSLANHGRDGIYFDSAAPTEQLVAKRFRFERQGFSYRASEFEAAIGLGALEELQSTLEARRRVADDLTARLRGLPLVTPKARPGSEWWPMFYPVLSDRRDELCVWLEERGVETRPLLPLTCQPVYGDLFREADYPMAARVNREGFYVACHPGLNNRHLDHIEQAFRSFFV